MRKSIISLFLSLISVSGAFAGTCEYRSHWQMPKKNTYRCESNSRVYFESKTSAECIDRLQSLIGKTEKEWTLFKVSVVYRDESLILDATIGKPGISEIECNRRSTVPPAL